MSLVTALNDRSRFVTLYGTTPPRLDTPREKYERAVTRLADRVQSLPLDGLVVYDVQDERDRTALPRPFPFLPTHPSSTYASDLQSATGLPTVIYKCIAGMDEISWQHWLDTLADRAENVCLSLVGRATSRGEASGLSLLSALQQAKEHRAGFTLGGVVIPERHHPNATPPRKESERLLQKSEAGCRYFISQAIYDPQPTLRLLQDYAEDCRIQGTSPARILLTFTPCGRPQTLTFMKWLGIHFPPGVEQALLTAPDMLSESVHASKENLRTILTSEIASQVPLGINVESVSIGKEEIAASVALCSELHQILQACRHRQKPVE